MLLLLLHIKQSTSFAGSSVYSFAGSSIYSLAMTQEGSILVERQRLLHDVDARCLSYFHAHVSNDGTVTPQHTGTSHDVHLLGMLTHKRTRIHIHLRTHTDMQNIHHDIHGSLCASIAVASVHAVHIYRWTQETGGNVGTRLFELYHTLPLHYASGLSHGLIQGRVVLAVSVISDRLSYPLPAPAKSRVYRYASVHTPARHIDAAQRPGDDLEMMQTIACEGASGAALWRTPQGQDMLILSNFLGADASVNGHVSVYVYSTHTAQFELAQRIEAHGASDVEVFHMQHVGFFLAIANRQVPFCSCADLLRATVAPSGGLRVHVGSV